MRNFLSLPLLLILSVLSLYLSGATASPHGPPSGLSHHSHSRFHQPHHLFRRDDYTCSASKPCSNGACCGTSGYCGYGPTYCGAGCTSNCNAKAACGQYAEKPGQTCPLNTCCSEFGFCGTSEDFCTGKCQSNCKLHPKPEGKKGNGVLSNVIGYYESWSARSKCHKVSPSDLPLDALTHLNYAFAYVDPKTFEITTMDSATPETLFDDIALTKKLKSDLQVWISIGGWTFSDNGTDTQPVFGNIARTEANRKKFANNLLKFLTFWGFDGVDIDWEYPGAPDRGGKDDDTENYVLLMKTIRSVFNTSGRKLGITFTAPSSYWYLRWFDLPGLIKYVDWINLMTYDLHGTWDSTNPIGNIVQGHTNLTEIEHALELFWRVNIPPEKVYMGFGFYGRSFQLTDPNCSTPGCRFSGGANPGPCSDTSGILMYYEIMALLKENPNLKPVYDKEAGVKYLVFNNDQWVSYDDAETFKQKVEWANKIGLGGSLIWASDADDDKYTAHSGLVQKTIKHPDLSVLDKTFPKAQAAITSNLIRQNGQNCRKADKCISENDDHAIAFACESSEVQMGWAKERCGKGKSRAICCSRQTQPNSCRWRGNPSECNGQCHPGEVMVLQSSWGGSPREEGSNTKQCTRGAKAFCCDAPDWTKLTDLCRWTRSGYSGKNRKNEVCASDETEVATKGLTEEVPARYCCKRPAPFVDCKWKGTPIDCADAKCDKTEVAVDLDPWGQRWANKNHGMCNWDRNQALCCRVQVPPPRKPLQCTANVCDLNKGLCGMPQSEDVDESNELQKRSVSVQNEIVDLQGRTRKTAVFELVGRDSFEQILRDYPSRGQLYRTPLRRQLVTHLYYYLNRGPCPASSVVTRELEIKNDTKPNMKDFDEFPEEMQTEHPDDIQIIPMEVRALNTGLYPNGTRTGILPIDTRVIENLLFTNSLNPGIGLVNDYPRAREYRMPIMRLSEASGSSTNPDCFVPTERQINMAKGQVVGGVSPMSDIRFRGLARNAGRGDRSSQEELARQFDVVLGVFDYMQQTEFHERRQMAFSDRLTQWNLIERQFPNQLAGATRSAQLTANPRNRQIETFAQGLMTDWIERAQEQIGIAMSLEQISEDDAEAWSDQLNLYEGRIQHMTLPDLDTNLS